jgi:hypothetical protein
MGEAYLQKGDKTNISINYNAGFDISSVGVRSNRSNRSLKNDNNFEGFLKTRTASLNSDKNSSN